MIGIDFADRWTKRMARINFLMAAGMTAMLGFIAWSSLACSQPYEPEPMDREDSLAVLAIFRENKIDSKNFRYSTSVGSDGRVTSLYLSSKGLTVLPPDIRELDALRYLHLDGNKLTTLPMEMEGLISLRELTLNDNQIEALPDGLRFENLKKVNLRGNKLRALPSNFDVTSVEDLDLSKNQIQSLPPDFSYLHNLVRLNLEANQLDSLGFELLFAQSLKMVDISGNKLTNLPPSILELQPDFLDVGGNRLCFHKQVDPDSLTRRTLVWLDSLDRNWQATQTCP